MKRQFRLVRRSPEPRLLTVDDSFLPLVRLSAGSWTDYLTPSDARALGRCLIDLADRVEGLSEDEVCVVRLADRVSGSLS